MIVYSTKIIRFIGEIKSAIKSILVKEVGLRVHGERFYDKTERYSYPIKIVVYNNKKMLGYFASDLFELGFHELLIGVGRQELHNIIRHELAHYLCFIKYGQFAQSHGPEFKEICVGLGWGEEVYRATTCLETGTSEHLESSILRKVQKLMALAASANPHEAEQAMIKARELLLKHNIDEKCIADEPDVEKVFLKRVLKQRKECAKMRAIATILDTFFVNTVFSRGTECIYLEIVGSEVNVEIAEYVANFLDVELENLWEQAKKTYYGLKGMVAKNSFFLGIAKGYAEKIKALKRTYSPDVSQALLVIEKKLVDAKSMVYPRLRYTRSNASFCQQSSQLGEQVGRSLTITPGIQQQQKSRSLLIPFFPLQK